MVDSRESQVREHPQAELGNALSSGVVDKHPSFSMVPGGLHTLYDSQNTRRRLSSLEDLPSNTPLLSAEAHTHSVHQCREGPESNGRSDEPLHQG